MILPHPQDPHNPGHRLLADFASGEHDLQPDHKTWLEETICQEMWVYIKGMASRLGSVDSNLALSNRRAHQVAVYALTRLGLPAARITGLAAVGEAYDLGPESGDEARWRAVEVRVSDIRLPALASRAEPSETLRDLDELLKEIRQLKRLLETQYSHGAPSGNDLLILNLYTPGSNTTDPLRRAFGHRPESFLDFVHLVLAPILVPLIVSCGTLLDLGDTLYMLFTNPGYHAPDNKRRYERTLRRLRELRNDVITGAHASLTRSNSRDTQFTSVRPLGSQNRRLS